MKHLWITALLLGAAVAGENGYRSESPLPQGWPAPGPYDEVAAKRYPAYRAAFTTRKGETIGFWTLFRHIKKQDIPMTAPVEMPLREAEDRLARDGMAFLYQDTGAGETGADGKAIEVRDVEPTRALSYAWLGPDSKQRVATARRALDEALAARGLEAKSFRLLGYNSPGMPEAKRTWELQALLE